MSGHSRRPKMLLVGNSHIQMVKAAQAMRGDTDYEFESCWLKSARHGDTSLEEAEARIAALDRGDLLVLTRLGSQHNAMSLYEHDLPYRVFDPATGGSDHGEAKVPIPVSALRAEFSALCAKDNGIVRLCASRPCRIVHYGAPPPKARFDKSFKIRKIDGELRQFDFNDASTRLAMWKIESDAVSARLSALDIEECPVPPEAFDAEGFLDELFWAQDVTHANEAYGHLLLDHLAAMLIPGDGPRPADRKEDE